VCARHQCARLCVSVSVRVCLSVCAGAVLAAVLLYMVAVCVRASLMTSQSVILMTSGLVMFAQKEARSLSGFYSVRALLCSVSVCVLSLTV
jgi:hypothetical protein